MRIHLVERRMSTGIQKALIAHRAQVCLLAITEIHKYWQGSGDLECIIEKEWQGIGETDKRDIQSLQKYL